MASTVAGFYDWLLRTASEKGSSMISTTTPQQDLDQLLSTPKVSHQHPREGQTSTRTSRNNATSKSKAHGRPTKQKGYYEFAIFLAAVVTGTGCSILSKVLYELQGVGINGKLQKFDKPLFQTLAMFAAMLMGIPMHWIVVALKIPIPGYAQGEQQSYQRESSKLATRQGEQTQLLPLEDDKNAEKLDYQSVAQCEQLYGLYDDRTESASLRSLGSRPSVPRSKETKALSTNTYLTLALLSLFDLTATALCAVGLLYLNVSVYQMLRGSGIVFVALLRQYGLKQQLFRFQWVGVWYNVLSILLVGTAALLSSRSYSASESGHLAGALLGVTLMLAGSFVQSGQFVLEEKIMVHDAVKVPPLLLFGMEGVWGFLFSLFILLPAGNWLRYENSFNTLAMLWNTPSLQFFVALYMLAIFGYNLFAVLVTFSLTSMWHSILDNFRPMTVWLTDLILFGATYGSFGESWTSYSWIELAGLSVLLYGTAIYNAPDVWSIPLKGQWFALGINLEEEYLEIEERQLSAMCSYPSMHRFLSQRSLRLSASDSLRSLPDMTVLEV
jgi:hypothetical protein